MIDESLIAAIFVDQLGVEVTALQPGAQLVSDLGADSLDVIELVLQLEDAFGLEIPDAVAEKFVTYGEVVDYVNDHQNS